MEDKEVLKQVVDNLVDTPDVLTVSVKPRNRWQELLMKYKLLPAKREYKIYRLKVGNAYRVSKAVLEIPSDIVNLNERSLKDMHTLLINHIDTIIYVVAVALQNSREEPSKALLNRIRWDFNDQELLSVLVYVIQKLDLTTFTNSIALARGADILSLKASPAENAEIIARSDLSEA
ncbi:hypothetical protein [Adhaeribacter aquaticus]|uniref:hypothetical protein n=1 Tax=Adhaeribacter aquaticus TaxID=299567 RepID=UPI0003F81102|nr:hypothetical protein [Adhaeribacter aquaticus]